MTPMKNEGARAFHALQIYRDLGAKRSLAKVAKKLGVSRQLIERWSRQHSWQKRIRDCMVADAMRSGRAAEQAALDVAVEKERLALRHTQQKLRASERLFERAHEVLRASTSKSRPSDSARMFLVASELGNQALGLGGGTTAAFGLNPVAAPIIRVVLRRDAQSDELRRREKEFLAQHPEFPRPRNGVELEDGNGLAAD